MTVLLLNGSSRQNSTNGKLLHYISTLTDSIEFQSIDVNTLPLFSDDQDCSPWSEAIVSFREAVSTSDGVIISTPEYIHNIPAVLKNALEWLTKSGELAHKPTLAITYLPHVPRGDKAMQSLLFSLKALDARVVAQMSLYHTDIDVTKDLDSNEEGRKMVRIALTTLIDMLPDNG